ncbi:unnamed protein product, partial [marine sediment metagenome]
TNLDGVTSEDTGDTVDCRWYNRITVQIICKTTGAGAVTVTIQGSVDGTDDNWHDLDEKTYTATDGKDLYHYGYNSYYPYIRTKTSTHSLSTVTTFVAARN